MKEAEQQNLHSNDHLLSSYYMSDTVLGILYAFPFTSLDR